MDHREFMDDIIKGMTETKEVPMEDVTEPDENNLKIVLSTGETFAIDAEKFDWDSAIERIPLFIQNHEALRQMAGTVLGANNDEINQVCNTYIEQLKPYLESYQTIPHYDMIDPEINEKPLKHFMMLLYDTQNVLETMYSAITMYSAMKMLSPMTTMKPETDDSTEDDKFDGSEKSSFMIEAKISEGGLTIISITPDEDCPPDEYYMPDPVSDGRFKVHVFAKSILDARKVALESFKEAGFPVYNTTSDFDDDKSSSGLLEE